MESSRGRPSAYRRQNKGRYPIGYEGKKPSWESIGIPIGDVGTECDRALWYGFRRVSLPEKIDGRKKRNFDSGKIEEERIISDLRWIGCEVTDEQAKVFLVGGHLRGKIDAKAKGVPEAPVRVHLVECKSTNDKGFKELLKGGLQVARPMHYATVQTYMHGMSLERCLYACVNRNDDDYYTERVAYDAMFALRTMARAERIVRADDPPVKLHENPASKMAFACGFCRHVGVCHHDVWPRMGCRTCLHSTPTMNGDAEWLCEKHGHVLTLADQDKGCGDHLFLPGLIPGEQIDASETTVTYRLKNGSTWVNGGEK